MFIGVGAITAENGKTLTLYEGGKLALLSESPITIDCAVTQKTNGLLTIATVPPACKRITIQ